MLPLLCPPLGAAPMPPLVAGESGGRNGKGDTGGSVMYARGGAAPPCASHERRQEITRS